MAQITSGQVISNPVIVNDPSTQTTSIYIQEKTYIFRRHELYVLKGNSGLSAWVSLTMGATIGFLINIAAKFIYGQISNKQSVEKWEIYAFLISLGITIILALIDKFIMNDERKRLISQLENHFNS